MSVSVNCWYCSEDSLVPAHSQNSWECPKCDQFNSFTADGDVTPAAAAASAQPRAVRYNVAVKPATAAAARWQLCQQCNLQQQLKARQLAEFRPVLEHRWEQELEEYSCHLERVYQPCAHCQAVVASALREADERVRPAWLAWLRRRLPATGRTGTGQTRSAAVTRSAALTAAAAARGAVGRLCSTVSAAVTLVLPAGLLLLLLLLCNNTLLALWPGLVPTQYRPVLLELEDVFSESRAALLVICFGVWVLTARRGVNLQTVTGLLLWTAVSATETLVGPHITASTAAQLQTLLLSALLLLSLKSRASRRSSSTVTKRRPSSVLESAPASSTPKAECNGTTSGHNGPISNGHGPPASSDDNLPSPITAQQSAQADYDYNLPRLSLGSPRRPAGSGGVFALRTYRPGSGGSLFADRRQTPLLSPARLRSEVHHSSWIAGGYWQRGQAPPPAAGPQIASRSSSQSSGFVDACGPAPSPPPAAGSVHGEDEPAAWAGSQCDAPSCAGDTWLHAPSCVGSQRSDWRSCAGEWRGRPPPDQGAHLRRGPAAALDSSSLLSDRSVTSHRTATSGMSEVVVTHRSLLIALLLGFSMAFNMFAVLLLFYKDRL
ncbi:Transmembrane protein 201 [Amphibalanus amphitrite]|uniref:Transmembrane protein 201 n=1 Tax=Amphibalanus amphitrite TaxID=1232801 RepID=A0A6A4WFT7_AMPAM|nr:transmembrane protein 201-like [Amphibalanus amphitrite]XP_043211001.1 transmembrane protein 201-like [Amphibalanus amphitrite]XP_043211002.1 transmembrane protein 201-like [Amphibalanus amphitrite]KAF0301672.1 Transmembrane protein 201 [Amphibalanus amphitrite]